MWSNSTLFRATPFRPSSLYSSSSNPPFLWLKATLFVAALYWRRTRMGGCIPLDPFLWHFGDNYILGIGWIQWRLSSWGLAGKQRLTGLASCPNTSASAQLGKQAEAVLLGDSRETETKSTHDRFLTHPNDTSSVFPHKVSISSESIFKKQI